jgi:hypothetical protein
MVEWNYLIAGTVFTLVMLRLLKGPIVELFFFGAVFGLIEAVHYWGAEFIGLPDFPVVVHKFAAGALIAWIIFRLLYVIARQWVPALRPISRLVFGKA